MKNWIADHPYLVTSAVFLVIMVIGWQVLYWQGEDFTFLLLLYFIVTLGIRLDDISRKIGGAGNPDAGSRNQESVIGQLNDIKVSLARINLTLNQLLKDTEKEE